MKEILTDTIRNNITLGALRAISHFFFVDKAKEIEVSKHYFQKLDIRATSERQLVSSLSGGNQQKVVIAKTLAGRSRILLFDEPTRGVDVGAKQEIYKLMNDLTQEGHSIIMVSSDMEELLGMSDRILVMYGGTIQGELQKDEFSQEAVLELASGLGA